MPSPKCASFHFLDPLPRWSELRDAGAISITGGVVEEIETDRDFGDGHVADQVLELISFGKPFIV